MRRPTLLLIFGCVFACSSKKPTTPLTDREAASAAAFDTRLGKLAVARDHEDADGKVRATVFVAATSATNPRAPVGFRFRRMPENGEAPEPPDRFVALGATLEEAPGRPFVIGVRLPEHDTRGEIVKLIFARARHSPPVREARLVIARAWNLTGESIDAPYRPVALEAVVMGHRLVRNDTPRSFTSPGEGSWTLFKITTPAEGYVALDWESGAGEIIPRKLGVPDDLGADLFRLF